MFGPLSGRQSEGWATLVSDDQADSRERLKDYVSAGTQGVSVVASARVVDDQKKEATIDPVLVPGQDNPDPASSVGRFTIECDEPPRLGGTGSAPQPMQYLLASVAF